MSSPHCTSAVTEESAVGVNQQVFVLLPPLEHAPDQIASRPFETVSVIAVPTANDADPVLPTATLMPAGLEVIRSPLVVICDEQETIRKSIGAAKQAAAATPDVSPPAPMDDVLGDLVPVLPKIGR